MATTAMIIEILVIGFTSFVWLLPIMFFYLQLDVSTMKTLFDQYKEWAPLFTLFGAAIAYQIGSIIDYLSYNLIYHGIPVPCKRRIFNIGQRIKRKIIKNGWFWDGYVYVNQHASEAILSELKADHSSIRLTRSGFVNFLLIAVVVWFLPYSVFCRIGLAIILILTSTACILTMRHRWINWYAKMAEVYCKLKIEKNENWQNALIENSKIWMNKT